MRLLLVFNLRFHDFHGIKVKESGLNLPAAQGMKKYVQVAEHFYSIKMCTHSSRGPPSLDGFGWATCVMKTIVYYTALEIQMWKIICNCPWYRTLESRFQTLILALSHHFSGGPIKKFTISFD